MSEKVYSNSINNVKKARENGFFSCENEEKAGEKERLYFNSERKNAGLSGVKRKVYFLIAHRVEK